MIIQSPLHKPSRVFTIHSFSNSLSLSSDEQFQLAIRNVNSRYQPFLSAVLTAIPDTINPPSRIPFRFKIALVCVSAQVSTVLQISSSERSESPAGTRPHEAAGANLSSATRISIKAGLEPSTPICFRYGILINPLLSASLTRCSNAR